MTYVLAAGLQEAVFQRLSASAAVSGLVGGAVFDAAPEGRLPPLYVALGPEDAVERSDKTGRAARHQFTISIVSEKAGFHLAKQLAGAVEEALTDGSVTLSRGRLVSLMFYKARARRVGSGARRRIDMQFRALVDDV